MNARSLVLSLAAVATLVAGLYHWQSRRTRARLDAERSGAEAAAAHARRLAAESSRQVVAARDELQALLAARASRPASPAATNAAPKPAPVKSAPASVEPEVRRLQVQAFVSEQRLRFAALLKRLGFTGEQLQRFDRIHAASQDVLLDPAQSEWARQQARQARDAQLKDLFGPSHDAWLDAQRSQPARAVVAEIVRQTFQSSGALTTAQADELARIVGQHRVVPPPGPAAGPARYDWDRIIADARSILADRQMHDFIAAVEFRRASEQMVALAAKRKP
jgi:hypothetical protein